MSVIFYRKLTAKAQYVRWGILGFGLAIITAALLPSWGIKIPMASCLFQRVFGIPGPGCGLTRSFIALARGDWLQALMYHLFGPLLFALCAIATLQAGIELLTGHSLSGFAGTSLTSAYRQLFQPKRFIAICLLLLGYYLLRLYVRHGVGDLSLVFGHTSLWQLFVAGAKAL